MQPRTPRNWVSRAWQDLWYRLFLSRSTTSVKPCAKAWLAASGIPSPRPSPCSSRFVAPRSVPEAQLESFEQPGRHPAH